MRRRIAIVGAALALVSAGFAACGDEDTTTTVTEQATTPTTTESSTTSTTSSSTTSTDDSTSTTESTTTESEDVSGNCDEAEHADDPECAGGVAPDDSSGSGGYSYGSG